MRPTHSLLLSTSLSTLATIASAISLDASSSDSICSAASTLAAGAMDYYKGDGVFDSPSYWWMYGTAFASLLNYQHICGSNKYQDIVYNGILAQVGENYDFQPSSYLDTIGNDDIGTWALLAIQAAEMGFKDPSDDNKPSWAHIASNAFNVLYDRWDEDTCNGGLRWQFNSDLSSYNYKATIANGNLFQLAARLARYTGNSTYTDAAESIYEWIYGSGLTHDLEWGTEVYDGFNTNTNCTDLIKVLWTYNYGVLIGGSAYMYDVTKDDDWKQRVDDIILGSQSLYNNTILYEKACETYDSCNTDQTIFKAIYTRYLGATSNLISSESSKIHDLLLPGAKAAAKSCSGGDDKTQCGMKWSQSSYDGNPGLGQQLNALEIILNLIVDKSSSPKKA